MISATGSCCRESTSFRGRSSSRASSLRRPADRSRLWPAPICNADGNGGAFPPDRARRNPADESTSVGRNSETTAAQFNVDVRVSKRFRSHAERERSMAIVEAFNVFNQDQLYRGHEPVLVRHLRNWHISDQPLADVREVHVDAAATTGADRGEGQLLTLAATSIGTVRRATNFALAQLYWVLYSGDYEPEPTVGTIWRFPIARESITFKGMLRPSRRDARSDERILPRCSHSRRITTRAPRRG